MTTLLVLGAGKLQLPLIKAARDDGLEVIAIDPNADALGFVYATVPYVLDIGNRDRCLEIAQYHRVQGVVTLGDFPVPTLAFICSKVGLPGPSPDAAENATNKERMRLAFQRADVPSPQSIAVTTEDEGFRAAHEIAGAVIVKPALSSGGRGVTRLAFDFSRTQFAVAFSHAKNSSRNRRVLIESFIDGPEFSVELITYNAAAHVVAVTRKETTGPPHFVEIAHSQPPDLATANFALLTETAIRSVAATGIDHAASHAEIRLSPSGPVMMEVSARLGGGYITSDLVPLSCGVDMVRAAIAVALGRVPDLRKTRNRGSAVRFITASPGIVGRVDGLTRAQAMPGCVSAEIYVSAGDAIKELKDSTGRVGHVIAEADDARTAAIYAHDAARAITVKTDSAVDEITTQ